MNKKIYIIYIAVLILWIVLALFKYPCGSDLPLLEIWLVSLTSLLFVLAWYKSIEEEIVPNNLKNFSRLFIKSSYETFKIISVFILISFMFIIFMPTVKCYTDRDRNSAVLQVVYPVKKQVEEKINSTKRLINDYSEIAFPSELKRIKFIKVTKDGVILVHSESPEFSVYLIPSIEQGKINWLCYGFPEKTAPVSCRKG